jgi:SAM-dependent methyltransferase
MTQVTDGIRTILSNAGIYDLFQKVMGSSSGQSTFVSEHIRARPGDRVLDIGCGTAGLLSFLPSVKYYGFDPDPEYIKAATEKYRGRPGASFICGVADEPAVRSLGEFDIVVASGVLHHLDTGEALALAKLARTVLKEGGRLVTLDPCLVAGQSRIARFLALRDRGQNVRDVEGYRSLVAPVFDSVTLEIRHDLGRIPYTHLIMECASR